MTLGRLIRYLIRLLTVQREVVVDFHPSEDKLPTHHKERLNRSSLRQIGSRILFRSGLEFSSKRDYEGKPGTLLNLPTQGGFKHNLKFGILSSLSTPENLHSSGTPVVGVFTLIT